MPNHHAVLIVGGGSGGISVAARLRLAQPALSPIACERGWMTSRCDHDEAQLPVTRRSDHLRSS